MLTVLSWSPALTLASVALVCSVIADVTNSILLHLVYLHDSPMSVEMKRFGVSAVDLYMCVCVCVRWIVALPELKSWCLHNAWTCSRCWRRRHTALLLFCPLWFQKYIRLANYIFFQSIDFLIYKMLNSCIDCWLCRKEMAAHFSWFSL